MPDPGHHDRVTTTSGAMGSVGDAEQKHVVIVGASLAGLRSAESLRAQGFVGRLTIVGDEGSAPYDRPPLSKQYLSGAWGEERLWLRTRGFDDLSLDLQLNVRAEALNIANHELTTSTGDIPFDGLVIATGARPRRLPEPLDHRDHFVVRTKAHSDELRDKLNDGAKVVVIGAGFIGAEVAATARGRGCEVTILEAAPLPLERQLGPDMARVCAGLHERNGVTLHTGVTIVATTAKSVTLADGRSFAADVVVVGVGVQPNIEWLQGSGLTLGNGIECDETCRAAPAIVAVGDVACWPNVRYDERARVEHWTNAAEMAEHGAATLLSDLNGTPEAAVPYMPVPYFWSDQYATKIQFLGRVGGFDEVRVVAGDADSAKLLALYRRGDRVVGALGLSMPRHVMAYRRLLLENAGWHEALASVPVTKAPGA